MTCRKEQCTACGACINICPVEAIVLQMDESGFYQVDVNDKKCVHCNACEGVCPITAPKELGRDFGDVAYAVWNLDDEVRNASSSGGAFGILAAYVLNEGGIVYGAAYQENWIVKHIKIDNMEDLHLLQHSKYVHSKIGLIYRDVENELRDGRKVLFSGTPCQIAGLYGYLGKDPEQLLTCEILCHGVSSVGVYQTYIAEMEKKYNSKIKDIDFRYKINGRTENIRIEFYNGTVYAPMKRTVWDPYFFSYMFSLILRDSCHQCKFTNKANRTADFVIGDFWGLDDTALEQAPDRHASLVLLNSHKAKMLFGELKAKIYCLKRTVEQAAALNGTLGGRIPKPNRFRRHFLNEYVKKHTLLKSRILKVAKLEFWCKMQILKVIKIKR